MAQERIDIVVTERGSRAVRRNIEDIGKGAKTAQGAVSLLNRTLGLIGIGVGVESFFRLSDAATTARNRLAVLGGSVEQTSRRLDMLYQIANNSGQSVEALVSLFQKGAIAAKDLGASEQNLFKFVKTVGDALRIQGSGAEESRGALLQLSQALSTGIVRAEEFNSVMENAYPIALAAARGIDKAKGSVGQLRVMIVKGQVTSKEFFEAVISQYDKMGEEALRANLTIAQSFTILRNKLIQFTGALNDATGVNRMISDAILGVANNIDKLVIALTVLGTITAFNFLTSQVVTFGATVASVLGFVTKGFATLGTVIATSVLGPLRLLGAGFLAFGKASVPIGAALVAPFRLMGVAILGVVPAVFSLVRSLTVLSLLFVSGGPMYLASLVFNSMKASILGLLTPTATLARFFGILKIAALGFVGTFALIAAGVAIFVLFGDKIKEVIDRYGGLGQIAQNVMSAITDTAELMVAAFVAAYRTIIETWKKFPAALGDLVIQGVNAALRAVHELIDGAIGLLNKLPSVNIDKLDPFKGIENKFAGSAREIAGVFQEEFNKAIGENQLEVMKKKFTDFTEFLKKATPSTLSADQLKDEIAKLSTQALGGGITPVAGEEKRGKKTFKDYLFELQNDYELTKMSNMEREKQQKIFDIEEKLRRRLTDAERAQANELLNLIQAQKDENSLLEEINGPQEELIRKTDTLNRLFAKGKISVEQFTDKLRELKIAALEAGRDMSSGLERGLLKIQEEFGNVATVAESAMTNSMKSIEDAFVEMAMTGKFQFKDLVNTIHAEITRLAVRQSITKPIADWLGNNSSGVGGFLGGLLSPNGQSGLGGMFSGLGSLFGFANGGEFEVGGSGHAPDTQLVQFKATKGEKVKIYPKGQEHGSDRPINVNFNISTPDANSFTRSQGQILAKTQAALARANKRNN